jgi:hypothetical protein
MVNFTLEQLRSIMVCNFFIGYLPKLESIFFFISVLRCNLPVRVLVLIKNRIEEKTYGTCVS